MSIDPTSQAPADAPGLRPLTLDDFADKSLGRFSIPTRCENQRSIAESTGEAAAATSIYLRYYGALVEKPSDAWTRALSEYAQGASDVVHFRGKCEVMCLQMIRDVSAAFVRNHGVQPCGLGDAETLVSNISGIISMAAVRGLRQRLIGCLNAIVVQTIARISAHVSGDDPVYKAAFDEAIAATIVAHDELRAAASDE